MSDFCNTFDLVSLIKEPPCYKNPEKSSCIDLVLTNKPRSFQNSCVIETCLSDFHKMIPTATKMTFQKLRPRVIAVTKNFDNENYRKDFLTKITLALDMMIVVSANFLIYVE